MVAETMDIKVSRKTDSSIAELDWDNLAFGRVFSDHMFVMEYADGEWKNPEVSEYADLKLSPATSVLHYGQSFFEGMKAYRTSDGEIQLFRPEENAKRFNVSARRMCMPEVPVDVFIESLKSLIEIDKDWVPNKEGCSLYVRPFMIATDPYVGIKPSDTYKFMIFTCPVGAYYSEPVKVKIETEYSRAAKGGTGFAKAAGNYAGALYPAQIAQEKGYGQLIWTDALEHKYIEEAGTMNVIFQIGDTLITPKSSDTILASITRRSVVDIARDWGYKVEERKVLVSEVIEAIETGNLTEAFGAGTAATIAQISLINYRGVDYELPPVENREFSNKVKQEIEDIKYGKIEDRFNWMLKV